MAAERRVQRSFIKTLWLQQLVLISAILGFHSWAASRPNRIELGPRHARIEFSPASLKPGAFAPLKLAGAWTLTSDDPRFGGISALAVDGSELVALTDSGVLIRFSKPGSADGAALIRELPAGPADPRFKSHRDSEALLRDPLRRGWWVAFENRNELWLYDSGLNRGLGRIAFGIRTWPRNRGIEGIASDGHDLLLFPEGGNRVVRVRGRSAQEVPIDDERGRISDATRLPDGRLVVVNRNLTLFGFSNRLTFVDRTPGGYRLGESIRLAVSPLDNVEAVAPEVLPGGATRLWLMTDDNFQRPMRTLLIALDLPLKRPAARRPSSKSRA